MEPDELKTRSIEEAELRDADGLVFGQLLHEERVWTYEGTFRGHAVNIEFVNSEEHPSYRFNVRVYDAETNELVATGNGDRDWEGALSIVHWHDLASRWPNV